MMRHWGCGMSDLKQAAVSEVCALLLESAAKDGHLYEKRIEKTTHQMRMLADTDAEGAILRVVRAAREWREHQGMPDRTSPDLYDPAVRQEIMDREELICAIDDLLCFSAFQELI